VQLATRRQPGIRFETRPPQAAQVLPRMDVAGFVGFASSGPLDVAVPVEDPTQFQAVFGPDAPLAWDSDRGAQVFSQLGPAVRAFFGNGGRRGWIVRVASRAAGSAGQPQPNGPPAPAPQRDRFPIGGLLALDSANRLAQATLAASSAGSWADGLTLMPAVKRAALQLVSFNDDPGADAPTCTARVTRPGELNAGDLVRLAFPGTSWTLLLPVTAVIPTLPSPPSDPLSQLVELRGRTPTWVRASPAPPEGTGTIAYLDAQCEPRTAAGTLMPRAGAPGAISATIAASVAEAPPAGTLVSGIFGATGLWIYVEDVELSVDGTGTLLTGTALELRTDAPTPAPWTERTVAVGEILTLSLQAVGGPVSPVVVDGLGFLPEHPRFLGALPTDEQLYEVPTPSPPGTLAADVAVPRFPLAAEAPRAAGRSAPADPSSAPVAYVPVTVGIASAGPSGALRPAGSERARDGLERFDADCFVDPDLAGSAAATLLADAQAVGDLSLAPRRLLGMHALLAVDEVTIVVLPDAAQRGWESLDPDDGSLPVTSIGPTPGTPVAPDWSHFLPCDTIVPTAPALSVVGDPTAGTFSLSWTTTDAPEPHYELQQATLADLADAVTIYQGQAREFNVYGRPAGATLWCRVRASSGANTGGWSPTLVVTTLALDRWLTIPPAAYDGTALLATQLAALRMCAARGDMFAVLALPEHYRTQAATAHLQTLRAVSGEPDGFSDSASSGVSGDPICGYGAVYHPWLWVTDPAAPGAVTPAAPDGAAAGVVAGRSFARGPWIAPANQLLTGVVALDPPVPAGDWQTLLDTQLNFVRDDSEGFRWLAADTLTASPDIRPIGVRRLLQALRRYALQRGATYAFEPNSAAFRRAVADNFDELLSGMWARGAFAGATPADSFLVSTASPPNSSASIDQGILIAEIRVAPSSPLAFLTVRLLRGADGALTTQLG
jgi:hypothetical protein